MATAKTKSDAMGYYHSQVEGLGGARTDIIFNPLDPVISAPIGPVVIESITPTCGEGAATIEAASTTELKFKAPGDTFGTAVAVAANTSVLLESGTATKAIRVYRDSVYNSNVLGGVMLMNLVSGMNNLIGMADSDENGGDTYAAMVLHNHSSGTITDISVAPQILGTTATTDGGQLGSSGSGTITTTDSFADWPTSGWALIKTNAPAVREAVYYSSRTATALTVPAAGRELLGTTAAAGASTDTIYAIAPLRVGLETFANGVCQTIADSTTAPTSITWGFLTSLISLAPGESRMLWMHREVPAGATVSRDQQSGVTVCFEASATAYEHSLGGYFRIGDTTLAGYELHVGEDAEPTFVTPTETSATLPFSTALSTSTTSRYVCRQRNQFDLESFNILTQHTVTGSGGEDETEVLTDPEVISIEAFAGGEVDLVLRYPGALDTTPADTWRLYITTDGTDPDPDTDDETDVALTITGFALASPTNRLTIGPYAYDTVVKVVARMYSSDLDVESASTTVSSVTVDTQAPVSPFNMSVSMGGFRAGKSPRHDNTTYYNDPTNTVGIHTQQGNTELFGAATAFIGRLDFWTNLDFSNIAHSTAGAATPIEVIDANTFYINVNSTRRAKIDLSGGTIEAATFVLTETALDVPVIGPTHTTNTATYLQIMDGQTGRWTPIVKVDSSGVFTVTRAVTQE